jgi:intein-encoded DNA endonuclease-like protein
MDLDITQIKAMYDQGKSLKEIATAFETYPQKIWRKMKGNGLELRSYSETQRIRRRKTGKYHFNNAFFETWSAELAWFLGLMYADGNIQNTRHRALLSSKDIDLLEQVRDLIGSNFPVELTGTNPQLYLYSIDFVECLERYGLTPAKSLTKKFPDVPPQFLHHFVRGYWDGNGSISIRKEGDLSIGVELASKEFIDELGNVLRGVLQSDVYLVERSVHKPQLHNGTWIIQKHPIYALRVHGQRARTVLNWMYQNSTPQTRLARKFEKAKKFLEHV